MTSLQIINTDTAPCSHLLPTFELLKSLNRSFNQIVRVMRAKTLGKNILNAGRLKHSPHGTAGNYAGTLRSRF